MGDAFAIAGYCRISVDEELDRDNTSIENQKAIIRDFAARRFPGCKLSFYEDRDRSGYTFEQREGYQALRKGLLSHRFGVLILKDFSRFSRRNSRGLVELEDLRDAGVRIISIGDNVDFPNDDDWLKIQFQFLLNEMPVTDTSRKVRAVVRRRQQDGQWICAAPYGYRIDSRQQFEVLPAEAEVVRHIFRLYLEGNGYRRIANRLTDMGVPTPRRSEQLRAEAEGKEYRRAVRPCWSAVTVQGILQNDFYIGTLRQGKYTRAKINGADIRRQTQEHIVLENHHAPIVSPGDFAAAQRLLESRPRTRYRGVKKYANSYAGLLFCGDCGAPMFALSRPELPDGYRCGSYHRRGRKACTSHHIRTETLDLIIKDYLRLVQANAGALIRSLDGGLRLAQAGDRADENDAKALDALLSSLQKELRLLKRQRLRELMQKPEREALLCQTYDQLEDEIEGRIEDVQAQLSLLQKRQSTFSCVHSAARTAAQVLDMILEKDHLEARDLHLILNRIAVFEDHLEIELRPDIDLILRGGTGQADVQMGLGPPKLVQRGGKALSVHVVREGDPLEIFTDRDGEIILKKYSPIGELSAFAKEYTESLFYALGHIALITDKDQVISFAGAPRKEVQDRPIATDLEQVILSRQTYVYNAGAGRACGILSGEEDAGYTAQVICPILVGGESVGAVVLLSREAGVRMSDTEIKVAQTAAGFIGRQMEP